MNVTIRYCLLAGAGALLLTNVMAVPALPPAPAASPSGAPTDLLPQAPATQAPPAKQDNLQSWTLADARALLTLLKGIDSEGLIPADYDIDALAKAIAAGEGPALNAAASHSFAWLIEDLRDGRTPMDSRQQWFVVDPDADAMPTAKVMADALASHDIAGVVARLTPVYPDYAALKQALAVTAKSDKQRIALIQANMDRWRWLPRDLGKQYLITNIPEYQLRLTVNGKIIRTYRTIVGKPGKTATPQLAEVVEGVIFNPTWTVPQSIVKGEGLGARLLSNPASAKAQGYKVTRSSDGTVTVVQQPGPKNSLGVVKLDMPNPHSIFLHDTPNKALFDTENRAYSHGCVRVQDARTMAMTVAIFGNIKSKSDIPGIQQHVTEVADSGEYTRVPITNRLPVYITYFTMGQDINGQLRSFADIYGRDGSVLASFKKPRVANRPRQSSEEVVEIVDDLQT